MILEYEKQIRDVLKEVFHNPSFTEQDYDELIASMFEDTGLSYASMNEEILLGIANGYSLEFQLTFIKRMLDV